MNAALQSTLLTLIVTVIIGGLFKIYFDYKARLLIGIWEKRLEAYMAFVRLSKLFSKYPVQHIEWQQVYQLTKDFKDWYFEGHGLVLSPAVRNLYFHLQESLLLDVSGIENLHTPVPAPTYHRYQQSCSQLRSQMARELETRTRPFWKKRVLRNEV